MDPQHPDRQVIGLLNLARDRSNTARDRLQAIAQDLFNGRERVLTQSDRILMHDMARSLVDRIETVVRSQLASYLGSLADAPHAAIGYLSGGSHSIAYSVLADSGVLGDIELVEALYHKALQHQLTLARAEGPREDLEELLAEALGPAARAPEGAAHRNFFRPTDTAPAPAVEAEDLPAGLVRRLCLWCSVALRQHILEKQRIDEVVLDDALQYAVEEASRTLGGRSGVQEASGAEAAADMLTTPDALVKLLEDGRISEFEAGIARLSQLRTNLVRRMIYEAGGEALATICVANEVPRRAFAAIFLLTRETETTGAQEVATALAFYDRLNPLAARRVLARWRRDTEYLNALRQIAGL